MLFAMHIPDGFLGPSATIVTALAAIVAVGVALACVRRAEGHRLVPLMGVMAAGIFAAQMVNVPLLGVNASGHLIGGVLAAVVLGPAGGAVAITAVLFVQCFLFGDGGITALGANVLNMAIIGSAGGFAIYSFLRRAIGGARGTVIAAAMASFLIIPISALAFAGEMAAGSDVPFRSLAALMLFYHVIIGLGEAVVTGLVVAWLLRVRPDLIYGEDPTQIAPRSYGRVMAAGLSLGIAIAVFAAPFASELDDGLETVAGKLGFLDRATESSHAPFPDYALAGGSPEGGSAVASAVEPNHVATIAAGMTSLLGLLGTLATWGFALALTGGARFGAKRAEKLHAL